MKPGIDNGIAPIILTPHTPLTIIIKEVVADEVFGSAWKENTPQQVVLTGINGRN